MDTTLFAYLAVTAALVVTPGASTALVVRHALAGGRPAGMAAASGIATANTTWAVAAGVGVTALVTRVPVLFSAIQFAGAGYLALLAVRSLYRAASDRGLVFATAAAARCDARNPFREGVTVNLLNPPVATFYMVVVPSFLPVTAAAGRFALFAAIHVAMAFACHALWVVGFERLRAVWARPSGRRTLEAATGLALLALAARMLE
jgi:threonine/homoserine/homoserine lactone efflux protein